MRLNPVPRPRPERPSRRPSGPYPRRRLPDVRGPIKVKPAFGGLFRRFHWARSAAEALWILARNKDACKTLQVGLGPCATGGVHVGPQNYFGCNGNVIVPVSDYGKPAIQIDGRAVWFTGNFNGFFDNPPRYRLRHQQSWESCPQPLLTNQPQPAPKFEPDRWPYPGNAPPLEPMPTIPSRRPEWEPAPEPLPFPRPSPEYSPGDNPFPEDAPWPAPRPIPGTQPAPAPWPAPRPRPVPKPVPIPPPSPGGQPKPVPEPAPVPGPGAIEWPGPGTRPVPRPRPARRRPPKPDEKEGKLDPKTRQVTNLIWWAFGQVTEYQDFVDSLYKALPKARKQSCGKFYRNASGQLKMRHSAKQKSKCVYGHFGEIDLAEAMQNLINNQVEDYLYGKLGKLQQKAGKLPGSKGPMSQPFSKQQQGFGKLLAEGGVEPLPLDVFFWSK